MIWTHCTRFGMLTTIFPSSILYLAVHLPTFGKHCNMLSQWMKTFLTNLINICFWKSIAPLCSVYGAPSHELISLCWHGVCHVSLMCACYSFISWSILQGTDARWRTTSISSKLTWLKFYIVSLLLPLNETLYTTGFWSNVWDTDEMRQVPHCQDNKWQRICIMVVVGL